MEMIDRYMSEINKYPVLSREQEVKIAMRYRETGDVQASHELVRANLRFVVKTAHEFRGYDLRLMDLVQEGNLGLVLAVKKFDPDKGYRLISYAVWWIRAYMWSYAMRSWSLVKLGTTQNQRKLFFSLRGARDRADSAAGDGQRAGSAALAKDLDVAEIEIDQMEARMTARDMSLDAKVVLGARQTHMDMLAENESGLDDKMSRFETRSLVREQVRKLEPELNEREGYIVANRLLAEQPQTLREIGDRFKISRERTRQIEDSVLRKLGAALTSCGLQAA